MQAVLRILLPTLLLLTSVFLILLVLVQRGRGGGLAGAFGGLGGQSAFGTKAGDLFTRVTIVVATFWIILCAASVKLLNDAGTSPISQTLGGGATAPAQPAGGATPAPGGATTPAQPGGAATTPAPGKSAPATSPAADEAPAADAESAAPASDAAPESDN